MEETVRRMIVSESEHVDIYVQIKTVEKDNQLKATLKQLDQSPEQYSSEKIITCRGKPGDLFIHLFFAPSPYDDWAIANYAKLQDPILHHVKRMLNIQPDMLTIINDGKPFEL